jgi:phage terminase large subunit GpA-like protein
MMETSSGAAACRAGFFDGFRPDPILTVSEWADAHRVLSSRGAAEPGPYRTSRAPYLREPMDQLSVTSKATMIAVMKGAQLGFTEVGHNWMGYTIHHLPCPMMIVEPTEIVMKRNIRQKIDPMIEDCPELAARIPPKRSKEGGNNLEGKEFPGGMLIFGTANSTASLRSTSIRHLMLDEIDEYQEDLNDQGGVLELAEARTFAYGDRAKIYIPSTPTIEGRSKIAVLFERSDKRFYMMPCPHCGERIKFEFPRLKVDGGDPETAHYLCQACDGRIEEWQKTAMLADGVWAITDPNGEFPGYHINSLYSPVGWLSWRKIMRLWFAAQGNPHKIKTFVNTILAETFKQRGDAPEWKRLYERREQYKRNVVPAGALMLTAGADVQGDRIEVEVLAIGPNLETWSVDYRVFPGNTASIDSECWAELARMLTEDWPHESAGVCMRLDRLGVDSGYLTNTVYQFARRHAQAGRIMVTKGVEKSPVLIGIPQAKEARTDGKRLKRGVKVWHIGTDMAKSELYGFLRLERPTEAGAPMPYGFPHFPEYDEEFFKMLTAEQVVQKVVRGYTKYEWEKTRERNEAIDCRIIARAVAYAFGSDRWTPKHWEERASFLGVTLTPAEETQEEPKAEEKPAQESKGKQKGDINWKRSSFW